MLQKAGGGGGGGADGLNSAKARPVARRKIPEVGLASFNWSELGVRGRLSN